MLPHRFGSGIFPVWPPSCGPDWARFAAVRQTRPTWLPAPFQAFFKRIGEGKFPDLRGRDEFWKVLVVIANRKAVSLIRHELAQVHGGGKVRGDAFLGDIASREPDPEVAAELLDESRHLLELVRREDTRFRSSSCASWQD